MLGISPNFQQNFQITLSQPAPGEIVLTGTGQNTPAQFQVELAAITYTDTSHYFPAGICKRPLRSLSAAVRTARRRHQDLHDLAGEHQSNGHHDHRHRSRTQSFPEPNWSIRE